MSEPVTRYINDCPRCGGDHYVKLAALSRPAGPYVLWAWCETKREPILALEKPLSLWDFLRKWPRGAP